MIYMCNYPVAELETEARSAVNDVDGCVFVCTIRVIVNMCVIKGLRRRPSDNQSLKQNLDRKVPPFTTVMVSHQMALTFHTANGSSDSH